MPTCNIIDNRTNKFKVDIMVIFEDSWHDNTIEGATQFDDNIPSSSEVLYLGIRQTTIDLAIKYAAQQWTQPVTLFLYDVGADNYVDYQHIEMEGDKLRLV